MRLIRETGRLARWAYNAIRPRNYITKPVPPSYRVVAFLPIFNEADIIEMTIRRLGESGVQVYVLDNWSTDGTWEIVQRNAALNLIGAERNPADGSGATYDLQRTAERIAALSAKIRPDWSLWHDADEYFQSPWPSISLRSALFRVDQEHYNAISFQGITFPPVDNSFRPGSDFVKHFQYWTAHYPAQCIWIRGWKGSATDVRIVGGSHDARFSGRYVYPEKFIIRHYPIRSQQHGEAKVFRERQPRYSAAGLARGWHVQYKDFAEGHSFLESPEKLHRLNEDTLMAQVREHGRKSRCQLCHPAAVEQKT
jgi:glycosyltransferase involved in cell wall biosynthesis